MRNNKGITLAALVLTIIVLLIIAGITVTEFVISIDSVNEEVLNTELTVLQNAVLQRYTKYTVTQNADILVGSTVTGLTSIDWTSLGISNTANYKQLSGSDLANLGISDYYADYIYVVNYINGDVIIKKPDGTLYNM